jgi:hypothetical protein
MSSSIMPARRLRAGLVLVVAIVAQLLQGPFAHASVDYKPAVASVATTTQTIHAQAYKQRLDATLRPHVDDPLGLTRLDAVRADVPGRYADEVRFATESDGRAAYTNDLHLTSWLKSRLSGNSPPAADAHVSALTDILLSGDLAAEAAVADAKVALGSELGDEAVTVEETEEAKRSEALDEGEDPLAEAPEVTTPGGREAALRDLVKAERALAKANKALGKGLPVTALVHDGLAWRHAFHVLVHLGITYTGDRDGDGVVDLAELRVGSSPLRADSDGDGLTDKTEIDQGLPQHLPGDKDTDDDGTADGAEDVDGDGLAALDEQSRKTQLQIADTDRDGSSDGAEVAAGTNPLIADTDDDGLLDGVEPKTDTDPNDADTDDDGVLDGAEVNRAKVTGPDGITATLVGVGDLVTPFRAARVTGDVRSSVTTPGLVGRPYDFSVGGADSQLQQAELVIPFDPADPQISDPANLRLLYLDEERHGWTLATTQQSVDTTDNVIRATVTHFSTYAIFDIRNWGQVWTAQQNPCRPRGGGDGGGNDVVLLDLALVLDSSGSMSWNDPQGLRKSAAKNFVDALLPEDRSAVVDFDSFARLLAPLTADKAVVKSAIDRIDDNGGTNIGAGVNLGNNVLINNNDPDRARMMILLTDGVGSYNSTYTQTAKTHGITIYTIALGTDVDTALLQNIATQTGGQFYQVLAAEDLPEVFRRISDETGGDEGADVDDDGDGLTNCEEINGIRSSVGAVYVTDPNDKDTDDDGLEDGEEAGEKKTYEEIGGLIGFLGDIIDPNARVYDTISDPTKADTDGDGLIDPAELDLGAGVWSVDSDYDGLWDFHEVDGLGTSPTSSDTDGDTFEDGYEDASRGDGFDPLAFTTRHDKWWYAGEFAKGLILGDLWRSDSVPWLIGSISSGASSVIPVIGWVTGTIADIRDVIGSAIHGDWVGSGFSAVGLIPYAGDAAAVPGKVAKFLLNNADKTDEVFTAVAKIDEIPTGIIDDVGEAVLGAGWKALRDAGFSEESMRRLLKGGVTSIDDLADAVRRGATAAGGWFPTGKAGEVFLEGIYGATTKGIDKQVWFSTKALGIGKGRFVDVLDATTRIAHESKVGFVRWSSSIETQILKDAALKTNGDITGAHWHFFASSASDSIGADKRVLDLLQQNGIPFTVHIP